MNRRAGADAAMAVAILSLGASLVFAGSSLLRLRLAGGLVRGPLSLEELIGAAAAGAGVAIALWWLVAMAAATVAAAATLRGHTRLATVASAWSPAFMRRLAAVVLGLNLVAMPLAVADPAEGPIDPLWHAPAVATAPAHPAAPTGPAHPAPAVPNPAAPKPAGANPAAPKPASPNPAVPKPAVPNPAWTPGPPAADPGPFARPPARHASGPVPQAPATGAAAAGSTPAGSAPAGSTAAGGEAGETVVVRRGDSLWSIAAAALGPDATDVQIADAWPRWYGVNRQVIGADPNVILPGQVLHIP